jgi:hypothetical protein
MSPPPVSNNSQNASEGGASESESQDRSTRPSKEDLNAATENVSFKDGMALAQDMSLLLEILMGKANGPTSSYQHAESELEEAMKKELFGILEDSGDSRIGGSGSGAGPGNKPTGA